MVSERVLLAVKRAYGRQLASIAPLPPTDPSFFPTHEIPTRSDMLQTVIIVLLYFFAAVSAAAVPGAPLVRANDVDTAIPHNADLGWKVRYISDVSSSSPQLIVHATI